MSAKKASQSTAFPSIEPAKAGFSAQRLGWIGPALQKYIDQEMVPNLVWLVVRHGQLVHLEARGYLDIESRRPARVDTIFRLYSNTKPITGAATMICVEEGLLSLDDPVAKFVPAFKNRVVREQSASGPPFGVTTLRFRVMLKR